MEPDYQNNYQDELHLDDEVYEIKSDRINPEYLNNPPRRKDTLKPIQKTCLLYLL